MYDKYEALRNERELKDFTVSKETGISASTISDWKSGKTKPKADKLLILAEYFGVPMEYFLREDEQMPFGLFVKRMDDLEKRLLEIQKTLQRIEGRLERIESGTSGSSAQFKKTLHDADEYREESRSAFAF